MESIPVSASISISAAVRGRRPPSTIVGRSKKWAPRQQTGRAGAAETNDDVAFTTSCRVRIDASPEPGFRVRRGIWPVRRTGSRPLPDGVDTELGLHLHLQAQHVRGIAGLLRTRSPAPHRWPTCPRRQEPTIGAAAAGAGAATGAGCRAGLTTTGTGAAGQQRAQPRPRERAAWCGATSAAEPAPLEPEPLRMPHAAGHMVADAGSPTISASIRVDMSRNCW